MATSKRADSSAAVPARRSRPPAGAATTKATVAAVEGPAQAEEPVWLVRTVLFLFLVGFAAFLAREVRYAIQSFP